ncbi:MAG TPA: hypothetical protein QGF05_09445 [Dehalococcoidia bacterium]|nr:hypothetical protein [Dehalococcoidia bacterium]
MTIQLIPATAAVLIGLIASGAVDPTYSGGDTHGLAWVAFGLSLAIVARDTLLGGSFSIRPERGELLDRAPLQLREGRLQIRIWQFEPVATTLAIMLGLFASQAVDMRSGGNLPDGDVTGGLWAAFALSLFLTIGGRMSPRPGKRLRRRREEARAAGAERWDEMGDEIEARVEEIFEDLAQRFSRGGRRDRP